MPVYSRMPEDVPAEPRLTVLPVPSDCAVVPVATVSICTVPAWTLVVPLKVLLPLSATVSVVVFVRPPVPLRVTAITPDELPDNCVERIVPFVSVPPITTNVLVTVERLFRFSTPPLIVAVPVPSANAFPVMSVPSLIVVPPLYVLDPVSTQVPAPDFTSDVSPVPLLPINAASVLLPVFEPLSVSVRAVFVPASVTAEVLLYVIAPKPEASSVAPLVPAVNCRSVVPVPPVYRSEPPLITRLAAALVEAPMPLATPPLASVATPSTPPLIVVIPE